MSIKNLKVSLSLVALVFASPIYAADQEFISIQSDTAEMNHLSGQAYYTGHVHLTQGSKTINADKLTIYRNRKGDIEKIIANGQPAEYEYDASKAPNKVHGHAKTIKFLPIKNELLLIGGAELVRNKDTFHGPNIRYNIKKQTVLSSSNDKERISIKLQPYHLKKAL